MYKFKHTHIFCWFCVFTKPKSFVEWRQLRWDGIGYLWVIWGMEHLMVQKLHLHILFFLSRFHIQPLHWYSSTFTDGCQTAQNYCWRSYFWAEKRQGRLQTFASAASKTVNDVKGSSLHCQCLKKLLLIQAHSVTHGYMEA